MDLQATHTPLFDFDLPSVTAEMKAPKTISTQASFMLMPWILIGSVGGLLLLLILISFISKGKKAKHHTKKAPAKKAPAKAPAKTTTPAKKTPAKAPAKTPTTRRKTA